jgi:hypothetical protein
LKVKAPTDAICNIIVDKEQQKKSTKTSFIFQQKLFASKEFATLFHKVAPWRDKDTYYYFNKI